MLRIYHNPRCQKSRAGLQFLQAAHFVPEIRDYMKHGLTHEEVARLSMKLNLPPEKMVRTQDRLYQTELKGRSFLPHEWFRLIAENPSLLQRPLIETDTMAVVAVPPEMALSLLNGYTENQNSNL